MSDEIDENKLDVKYYEMLVRQHHHNNNHNNNNIYRYNNNGENIDIKMEHSYTRDFKSKENSDVMSTRTILIDRTPPCPSCHQTAHDDKLDNPDAEKTPILPFIEDAGRKIMEETECEIRKTYNRNQNDDNDDWESRINKTNWTEQQNEFFKSIARVLDLDQMARLAHTNRANEYVRRRTIIDKSVSRMRQAFGSIHWEPLLTQWLHSTLISHLSPSYMVSYIEILQTLKQKLPTLVDKMIHGQMIDLNQNDVSLLGKRPWQPIIEAKLSKLPSQAVIVIIPSSPIMTPLSARMQRWHQLLRTLAPIVSVKIDCNQPIARERTLDELLEQIITVTRAKIQEIHNEAPNRQIILVGFNAGAAIALQVALTEVVSSVVCIGFAYNTVSGVRGQPDDQMLDITHPVLFVLGQIAQRSSQEEIESLREKMSAHTSLVVVGSADDSLRIKKMSRQMEGITQQMVDNMIANEIQEFAYNCIVSPPGPRLPNSRNITNGHPSRAVFLPLNQNNSSPAKRTLPNSYNETQNERNHKARRPRKDHDNQKSSNQSRSSYNLVQSTLNGISALSSINDELPPLYPTEPAYIHEIETIENNYQQHMIENPSSYSNITVKKPNLQKFNQVPSEKFIHIDMSPSSTVVSNEQSTTNRINIIEDMLINDNNGTNNSDIFDIMDIPILFTGDDTNEINEILSNDGTNTHFYMTTSQPSSNIVNPTVNSTVTKTTAIPALTFTSMPSSSTVGKLQLGQLDVKRTPSTVKTTSPIKYSTIVIPNQQNSFIKKSPISTSTRITFNSMQKLNANELANRNVSTTKLGQPKFHQLTNDNNGPARIGDIFSNGDHDVINIKNVTVSSGNDNLPFIKTGAFDRNITIRKVNVVRESSLPTQNIIIDNEDDFNRK